MGICLFVLLVLFDIYILIFVLLFNYLSFWKIIYMVLFKKFWFMVEFNYVIMLWEMKF